MGFNTKDKIIFSSKLLIPLFVVILLFFGGISSGIITFEPVEKTIQGEVRATIKIEFNDGNSYSKSVVLVNATVFDYIVEITSSDEFNMETTYWEQFDSYIIDSISYKGKKYESDQSHYWSYYINGEPGMEGADKVYVKNDDLIVWKYEQF
jgi:hypothetical protein